MVTGEAKGALCDDQAALKEAVDEFGDGLSKMAGDLIAAQVMAERVRTKEIPEQLSAIRDALTEGKPSKRVVILVDELDRCHPDYAIAFLEAMKLVFGQDGFVFCLFVNADYLEKVASHRFGELGQGEDYLDKFVDIRLKLPCEAKSVEEVIKELFLDLPPYVPYGEGDEFNVQSAAGVAGSFAKNSDLTMRQIKRIRQKVDLTIRCYANTPLDCPLLIWLAFQNEAKLDAKVAYVFLSRAQLVPSMVDMFKSHQQSFEANEKAKWQMEECVQDNCKELVGLPEERYDSPPPPPGRYWPDKAKVVRHLARHYIPSHQAMLDAVHKFDASA